MLSSYGFIDGKIYKVDRKVSIYEGENFLAPFWTWDKEETNDQKMHIQWASIYIQSKVRGSF
jgi:predicted transglutaminase-like protease